MDEKSYQNILIYDISYKTLIGAKPLHIMFDKVEGFIKVYDGARYLILFGPEKYDVIYNRIRYLISQKITYGITYMLYGIVCGITYVFSQNYAKIKIESYDSLPLEKNTDFA